MQLLTIFYDFPADDMKLFSQLEVFSSQIGFVEYCVRVLHGVKYTVGDYLRQSEVEILQWLFNIFKIGGC